MCVCVCAPFFDNFLNIFLKFSDFSLTYVFTCIEENSILLPCSHSTFTIPPPFIQFHFHAPFYLQSFHFSSGLIIFNVSTSLSPPLPLPLSFLHFFFCLSLQLRLCVDIVFLPIGFAIVLLSLFLYSLCLYSSSQLNKKIQRITTNILLCRGFSIQIGSIQKARTDFQ